MKIDKRIQIFIALSVLLLGFSVWFNGDDKTVDGEPVLTRSELQKRGEAYQAKMKLEAEKKQQAKAAAVAAQTVTEVSTEASTVSTYVAPATSTQEYSNMDVSSAPAATESSEENKVAATDAPEEKSSSARAAAAMTILLEQLKNQTVPDPSFESGAGSAYLSLSTGPVMRMALSKSLESHRAQVMHTLQNACFGALRKGCLATIEVDNELLRYLACSGAQANSEVDWQSQHYFLSCAEHGNCLQMSGAKLRLTSLSSRAVAQIENFIYPRAACQSQRSVASEPSFTRVERARATFVTPLNGDR